MFDICHVATIYSNCILHWDESICTLCGSIVPCKGTLLSFSGTFMVPLKGHASRVQYIQPVLLWACCLQKLTSKIHETNNQIIQQQIHFSLFDALHQLATVAVISEISSCQHILYCIRKLTNISVSYLHLSQKVHNSCFCTTINCILSSETRSSWENQVYLSPSSYISAQMFVCFLSDLLGWH